MINNKKLVLFVLIVISSAVVGSYLDIPLLNYDIPFIAVLQQTGWEFGIFFAGYLVCYYHFTHNKHIEVKNVDC